MADMFNIEVLRRRALQRSRQLAAVTGNPIMARRQLETELAGLNQGFSGARIQAERMRYANELSRQRLGILERQVGLGEAALEEKQKAAKRQQLGQSLTGLAQLGLAGKELGLFGGATTVASTGAVGTGVGAGGAGGLATAGAYAAPAAVGFGIGTGARALIAPEGHRGGERYTAAGVGAVGGAAAGAAIGTAIFPGVGTVIGGIIGFVSGAIGGGK